MSHDRIDFRALRQRASFQLVLDRYGMPARHAGRHHFILCPFHRETEASCLIDHARNRFRCFGCGETGSILDFVAKRERCTIVQAATIVAQCCSGAVDRTSAGTTGAEAAASSRSDPAAPVDAHAGNEPLRYRLRLDPTHPYLIGRGLSQEIIERFGLGYCDRGPMRGRIAIPIHDEAGRLIAYAGRWAAEKVPEDRPRYLLPRGFRKQQVLFNLHRVAGSDSAVLVESYWSVFRLAMLDVGAVALMGRDMSAAQIRLLLAAGIGSVRLMLDGDHAGRSATRKILPDLARHVFVRDLELPEALKPHSAPEALLRRLIGLS